MSTQPKRSFFMTLLNGTSLGIIIPLMPQAIFGSIIKFLLPFFPWLSTVQPLLMATTSMIAFSIGAITAYFFEMTATDMISVGAAAMVASGAIHFTPDGLILKGTGDTITIMFTTALAIWLIQKVRHKLGSYAMMIIPSLCVVVAGMLGRWLLPHSISLTGAIGSVITHLMSLEPLVVSVLLAVFFACLMMSPISTVGIALAIQLSDMSSGAANLGICACMFAFAIHGRRVNSLGTCIAHFIGSPKLSMPLVIAKPIILLPSVCSAAVMGIVAKVFAIQGTTFSAGFGTSGFVGPLAHLEIVGWNIGNFIITLIAFIGLPIGLGFLFDYVFVTQLKWIQPEDYQLSTI